MSFNTVDIRYQKQWIQHPMKLSMILETVLKNKKNKITICLQNFAQIYFKSCNDLNNLL